MGLMQSGSNFTDRIVKYVAKRAERKTKPASPPRGHVILYIHTLSETGCTMKKLEQELHTVIDSQPEVFSEITNLKSSEPFLVNLQFSKWLQ